jgi:hypothetical protein
MMPLLVMLGRATIVVLALAGHAAAADLYLISHPGVTLTAAEVREVFLGEKQFAGPVKLVPVDNATAQEAFLAAVLRMSSAKYSTAWVKKSFRDALNPPAKKATDAEVAEFVKRTPGAVGYVTSGAAGVNIIAQY